VNGSLDKTWFQGKDHPGTLQNFSSEKVIIPVQKTPVGILVHQSPLWARFYLVSLNPRILEVIIRKNAEPGRNNRAISGGNGGGHILQRYRGLTREEMWFGT